MFVLDKHGTPLQPTTPARARKLLAKGRAVVARHAPFVIRLKDRTIAESQVDGVELGIDPGSKHTGIAVFTNQDGTLHGTEVREYLLAKWGRACAYCGATAVPLNIDHIHPRSAGGSDRVANLCTACIPCNQAKGNRPAEEFLSRSPERLARVLAQAKAPLRDAAAVNATRWALWRALHAVFPAVQAASGGRTKWNRTRTGLPKTHTLDALCVGHLDTIDRIPRTVLAVAATGRGTYARTRTDKHGFPRLRLPRTKRFFGYATGDLVQATVPTGKWTGTHTGRVAVRSSGSHTVTTPAGAVKTSHKNLALLQRGDGYGYTTEPEGGAVGNAV